MQHTRTHNRSFKKEENVKHKDTQFFLVFRQTNDTHTHTLQKNGENVHTRASIIAATEKKHRGKNEIVRTKDTHAHKMNEEHHGGSVFFLSI